MRNHRQQQLHISMGPCGAIDTSSFISRWAHMKPSAIAAAYFDGPMRSHRHKQLHISIGPCDTIGSSSCICRWAHAKPLATTVAYSNWAQTKLSAAPVGKLMGPCEAIDSNSSICRKIYWSTRQRSVTSIYIQEQIHIVRVLRLNICIQYSNAVAMAHSMQESFQIRAHGCRIKCLLLKGIKGNFTLLATKLYDIVASNTSPW